MNSQRSKSLTDVTVSAQTPITQVHNKCKKSAHLVDRTNIPHDEHKPSFLRCGAAQNANVPVCERKIKPEINGIKEDVDILIPLKKIKLEVL
uniref:Uncharacterized protein n=1 Tax=Arion vulgaris TaxID=1028688 RepID=A0A0B7AWV5_9EUPU